LKANAREVTLIVSGLDKLHKTMEFQNQHGVSMEVYDLLSKVKKECKWDAKDDKKVLR
jgi:hypothetical protein|tara:strand:+ start:861 stop:1034 length:174 start_codon:yes stop_codon:yes gene_type:complete